jgi:hypothetical protein
MVRVAHGRKGGLARVAATYVPIEADARLSNHAKYDARRRSRLAALLDGVAGMPAEGELPHKAIVGAICISHALDLEQCADEPWAFGKVVNVISAVCRLPQPIDHSGALSVWKVSDDVLAQMQAQLATATIYHNDISHLPGPEAQPPRLSANLDERRRKREREQAASGAGASGGDGRGDVAPTRRPAAASSKAAAAASTLRDPRIENAVTHSEYTKSQAARHGVELGFEEWTKSFAGRVENVTANRLYIVELADADGEFKLGLIASEGKVFNKRDEESGEEVPHIKGLWFKRCSDSNHNWGPNPEFEKFESNGKRNADDLPTESCLLEVEDTDLTDGSVEHKWSKPKLKQSLMKKLRWIADKHKLHVEKAAPAAAKPAKRARRA